MSRRSTAPPRPTPPASPEALATTLPPALLRPVTALAMSTAAVVVAVLLAALAAAMTVVAVAAPADAHTELVSVEPADGAAVADPPVEVVLEFTEPLADAEAARVEVVDPLGDDLVAAPPEVQGALVTVPLNMAVAEGPHEVRWAVVAGDGHLIEGATTFTFAPPASAIPPAPTSTTSADDPAGAEPTGTDPAGSDPAGSDPAGSTSPTEVAAGATGADPTPPATPTPGDGPTDAGLVGDELDATGIPPALGVLAGLLVVAAVAAVALRRVRDGDEGPG